MPRNASEESCGMHNPQPGLRPTTIAQLPARSPDHVIKGVNPGLGGSSSGRGSPTRVSGVRPKSTRPTGDIIDARRGPEVRSGPGPGTITHEICNTELMFNE